MRLTGFLLLWIIAGQTPGGLRTAAVEGRTVSRGTSVVVSGAAVELRSVAENAAPKTYFGESDDSGRFIFAAVAPGRYRLVGMHDGYVQGEYGQKRPNTPGLVLDVASGQRTSDAEIQLTPTGTITGRVTDPTGRPSGIANVQALRASYQDGKRDLTVVQSTRTDDLGNYRLFWLAPGRYFVTATLLNGLPAAVVTLNADATDAGLSISRATRRTVLNRPVSPITDSEIYAPIFFPGTQDETRAVGIDVAGGKEVAGIDIPAGPVRTYRVRGTVVDGDTGEVIKTAQVRAAQGGQGGLVVVDAATGIFSIGRLPPGSDYVLTATAGSKTGRTRILVVDRDFEIRLPVAASFSVKGRVTIDGQPLSRELSSPLRVALRPKLAGFLDPVRNVPVAEDGSFNLTVGPAEYWLDVSPILGRAPGAAAAPAALASTYVKAIRLGDTDVLNQGVRLDGAPSETIEVSLSSGAAKVAGTVTDDKRAVAANAVTVLVPSIPLDRRADLFQVTRTDGAGRFAFDRVPPGVYRLFSWEDILDGAWRDPDVIRQYEQRGQTVSISDGDSVSTQLSVIGVDLP